MPPLLITLAPELLYRILGFCSRSDLVALSQVNRILQHSSEHILYRDIFLSFLPINLIQYKHDYTCKLVEEMCLFHTLSSPRSSSKSQLLRFFHIQFEYNSLQMANDPSEPNKFILSTICSLLPHSPNLVDLRIMIDQHRPVNDYSDGDFSDALSASDIVPNLTTLYIDAMNDVPGIFEARTSLRILGVYMAEVDSEVTGRMEDVFSILVGRRTATRIQDAHTPFSPSSNLVQPFPAARAKPPTEEQIVFLLETPQPLYRLSYLTLVPALYFPGSAEFICRQVVESMAQDVGKRYPSKCEDVFGLQLCLTNVSDGETDENDEQESVGLERVQEMMEAIVKLFQNCTKFKIKTTNYTMKAWRFPFFVSTISQFPKLSYLTFHLPLPSVTSLADDQALLEAFIPMLSDLRSSLIGELADKCPKLDTVVLISYEHNAIMERENGWRAVIRDNDVFGPEGWRGQPEITDEEGDEDDEEEGEDGADEEEEEDTDMIYISTVPPSFPPA